MAAPDQFTPFREAHVIGRSDRNALFVSHQAYRTTMPNITHLRRRTRSPKMVYDHLLGLNSSPTPGAFVSNTSDILLSSPASLRSVLATRWTSQPFRSYRSLSTEPRVH